MIFQFEVICGVFKKWGFELNDCVESLEHVHSDAILHMIRFWHQKKTKPSSGIEFPARIGRFWFFEIYDPQMKNLTCDGISGFSRFWSRSRMGIVDTVLESSDIPLFGNITY